MHGLTGSQKNSFIIGMIWWESLALDKVLAAELKKNLPASKTSWEYSKLLINPNRKRYVLQSRAFSRVYKSYLTLQMMIFHPTNMFPRP